METKAYGAYNIKGDKFYIIYNEPELENTSSIITADGESVKIKRNGVYGSVMRYREGTEHSFCYSTPYGGIAMKIKTKKVCVELEENGGWIQLIYKLSDGSEETENNMVIHVKKKR